jgi:hypothetical protein
VFLQNFSALPDATLPKVLSTSYGDDEDTVDYAYADRVGLEFQKLGARGVSVREPERRHCNDLTQTACISLAWKRAPLACSS